MKTKPDCATVRVAGDGACLWSWFSSVQAASHDEHGDRTRKAAGAFPFGLAVTSPLIGILVVVLALAIFVLEKSNRGLHGLNGSEGICVSSALSALSVVQQFFKIF